jgi:dihydrolipoamide dehydrogenase
LGSDTYNLVVIGGGPGGYVGAVRAAQLGLKTACIDANALLGGTCLRVGCIPSKALLESSYKLAEAQHGLARHGIRIGKLEFDLPAMLQRKDEIVRGLAKGVESLFKSHKVTAYRGHGRLDGAGRVVVSGEDGEQSLSAKHILLATGSQPSTLRGVDIDHKRVVTSTEAIAFDEAPQHLVVIGAGYIGLELGSVWKRLGSKVTVLEAFDRILTGIDQQIADEAQRTFQKQGLEFRLNSRVRQVSVKKGRCTVDCEGAEPIACDRVLAAVGRVPYTENLGLESVGIQCDEKGRIPVDDRFATSAEGIYAIGDCIGGPMLAHKASDEALACIERLVTGYGHVNYDAIPAVVYTHPEIAAVGQTEQDLQAAGREYRKGVSRFRANGRARTLGDDEGLVKLLADTQTDRLLGVHILGPAAGELIAEGTAALQFGASSEDLARVSHSHPTLSEALREAADAIGRSRAGRK